MKHINGNLLDTELQHIGHGVNCQGVMGSGVALAIRNKWPQVYEEYQEYVANFRIEMEDWNNATTDPKSKYTVEGMLLGTAQYVYLGNPFESFEPQGTFVANLFTQATFGANGKYARYTAVVDSVSQFCKDFPGKKLALPYKFASDRGGLNWEIVEELLLELEEKYDTEFWIYKL